MDQAPSPESAADTVSVSHDACAGRLPPLASCYRALPSGAGAGSSSDTAVGGRCRGLSSLIHMAVVYVSLFSP